MTLTRSKTKTQREAPGLHLLAEAIPIIEGNIDELLAEVKELKKNISHYTMDMAMPHENASKDNVEDYIHALEKVVEEVDIPPPPAPKQGYTQYYDHNQKKWVFCRVYAVNKHGVPIRN